MLLEYVLLHGVNTGADAAVAVAAIARRLRAVVNLIPFNNAGSPKLCAPTRAEIARFKAALEDEKVEVTERYRRGRDIAAACGQLRGKHPHNTSGARS